jgi:organic hydroperoxide reductase OsmC/OhrA
VTDPSTDRAEANAFPRPAGILDPQFQQIARVAKQSCLMSRALKTVSIELEARLDSSLVDDA